MTAGFWHIYGKETLRNFNNAAQRLVESFFKIHVYAPPRKRRRTTKFGYQSKREIERRARQIARGQLTASNGLVV